MYAIIRQTFCGLYISVYNESEPVMFETQQEAERELADGWQGLLGRVSDPLDDYTMDDFLGEIEEEFISVVVPTDGGWLDSDGRLVKSDR